MADQRHPRVGMLHRADGDAVPLVIHATSDPTLFEAETVKGDEPAALSQGDLVWVDALAPEQHIALAHVVVPERVVRLAHAEQIPFEGMATTGPGRSEFYS